jgi:hypothetical protein
VETYSQDFFSNDGVGIEKEKIRIIIEDACGNLVINDSAKRGKNNG